MANGLLGQIAGRQPQSFTQSFAQAQPIFQGIRAREEQGQARALQAEQAELTGSILDAGFAGNAIDQQDIARLGRLDPNARIELSKLFDIPATDDARFIGFTKAIHRANIFAQAGDPGEAQSFLNDDRNILADNGVSTTRMDKLLADFKSNTPEAINTLKSLDDSLKAVNAVPTSEEKLLGLSLDAQKLALRREEVGVRRSAEERAATKLSSFAEKQLGSAQDKSIEAGQRAREFDLLANDIEAAGATFGGGSSAGFAEGLKNITGDQDAISSLRRRYRGIKASQAVANLPPGSASDVDVALALSGFPRDDAPAHELASFMRGVAKLERFDEEFNGFKARLITEQGNTKGLLDKWITFRDSQSAAQAAPARAQAPQVSAPSVTAPRTIGRFELIE